MTEQNDDGRIAARRRMIRRGRIVFNNRNSVIDCTIRNLSETGAKLDVQNQLGVPSEFELIIGNENDNVRYAQTVWRKDKSIGITFLD